MCDATHITGIIYTLDISSNQPIVKTTILPLHCTCNPDIDHLRYSLVYQAQELGLV